MLKLACKKVRFWPNVVEVLLEAGATVNDAIIDEVHKQMNRTDEMLWCRFQHKQTKVLELLRRAREAQEQEQKYVPIYEHDAGIDIFGDPLWKRKEAM